MSFNPNNSLNMSTLSMQNGVQNKVNQGQNVSAEEMQNVLTQSRAEAEKAVNSMVGSNMKVTFVGQQVRGKFYPAEQTNSVAMIGATQNVAPTQISTQNAVGQNAPVDAMPTMVGFTTGSPAELAVKGLQIGAGAQNGNNDEKPAQNQGVQGSNMGKTESNTECQTCANRRYQDGSDDPSVSFQTPTKIDPSQVATQVMSHEMEHVRNETNKAAREGRQVVSQTVQIHTAVCPECGKTYVSGGTTTTVTKADESNQAQNPVEALGGENPDGNGVNGATNANESNNANTNNASKNGNNSIDNGTKTETKNYGPDPSESAR